MEWRPSVANDKRYTFTQLLLREIRAHFEHLAADPNTPGAYRDAFYAASREVGRNTPKFVAEARRKLGWQDAVAAHEDATNGR
jgi:hypothetical protein